ncbi:hypothetical protein ACS0TY_000108 [Phlomoides rotata]
MRKMEHEDGMPRCLEKRRWLVQKKGTHFGKACLPHSSIQSVAGTSIGQRSIYSSQSINAPNRHFHHGPATII